jgi:peptide/nickel transport system permease protein
MPKFVFLWTDIFVWLIFFATLYYASVVGRSPNLRASWKRVFAAPAPMSAALFLCVFIVVGLADSVHFRERVDAHNFSSEPRSVLDLIMVTQRESREKSYSEPLAYHSFTKEALERGGKTVRDFGRLKFGGAHLERPEQDWSTDVLVRAASGFILGALFGLVVFLFCAAAVARAHEGQIARAWQAMLAGGSDVPWRAIFWTVVTISCLTGTLVSLATGYHVFGTDSTGNDVFYLVAKSIRTALVMGSLTTAAILPFALVLGILSGYLKGWVDDLIQYFYTTISSVPSVLLIAACVLLIQVYIDKNPEVFPTGLERADIKLLFLCLIIGITEFSTMCRLIRGETLKLSGLDYVQAAQAFGASAAVIMRRHIMPNVMHIVIITLVLEFSGIVLYEAVLSYVGVGVDPSTSSFGTMINLARSEMARDPPVWWNLATAFFFMLTLVLAVNLFADGVRDAFDPRARIFRPRLKLSLGAAR